MRESDRKALVKKVTQYVDELRGVTEKVHILNAEAASIIDKLKKALTEAQSDGVVVQFARKR